MIDFTGKTLDYVQAALASHDIKCEVVEEHSDDVEEGKVIRTDPEAGAELEKGRDADRLYQQGQSRRTITKNVAVPGLLGMTEDDAAAAWRKRGLKIGSVDPVVRLCEAGSVVWQSQDAGAEVTKGHCRQHPDLQGKSISNNNSPDNSGGNSGGQDNGDGDYDDTPSLGSATIPVSLPDNTDTAHVIIYVDGVIQYDDTCSTSGGSTSISVSGSVGD